MVPEIVIKADSPIQHRQSVCQLEQGNEVDHPCSLRYTVITGSSTAPKYLGLQDTKFISLMVNLQPLAN